jgi:hypothetical protein
MTVERTRAEVGDILSRFLDGTGGPYDFDEFCSLTIRDPELEAIRIACIRLRDAAPSGRGPYTNEAGFQAMRGFIRALREA